MIEALIWLLIWAAINFLAFAVFVLLKEWQFKKFMRHHQKTLPKDVQIALFGFVIK